MTNEVFERGLAIRKEVLGAEFVEKAFASADDICAENNSATPQSRAEGDGANARARVPEDAGAVGSPRWPACGGRTRKRGEAAA